MPHEFLRVWGPSGTRARVDHPFLATSPQIDRVWEECADGFTLGEDQTLIGGFNYPFEFLGYQARNFIQLGLGTKYWSERRISVGYERTSRAKSFCWTDRHPARLQRLTGNW